MTNRHRFYRYLASGGVSTAAHYLTLYALVQMRTEPAFGLTTATLVGLVLNYSVSRRWVFDALAKIPETLARSALIWMLALSINAWVLAFFLALGFHHLVAQVTIAEILVLINSNLHRRWMFPGVRMPPFDKRPMSHQRKH